MRLPRSARLRGSRPPGPRIATRHRGIGPWHIVGDAGEPALQNGWVLDVAQVPAQFALDDYGVVHVNLADMSRSSGTGGTVFTLPIGFRPAYRTAVTAMEGTAVGFASVFGRLDILTDGSVIAQSTAKALGAGDVRFRKG